MKWLLFLFALFALPLCGQDSPALEQAEDIGNPFTAQFMKMLLILSIMVAVLIVIAWFTKKLTQPRLIRQNALSEIKVIEGRALSHKTMVWLIEVEERKFLIGESPAGLVRIGEFNKE